MTMIYTGKAAPLDGKRKLSAREATQRAKAMACVLSTKSTECKGQIYVGLFYDGTGNNDKFVEDKQTANQRKRNKHSNVARLFDAHLEDRPNGLFKYYIPGIGTPFDKIGDTSTFMYEYLGLGTGYKGADRINWGLTSLLNAIHRYLVGSDLLSPDEQGALVNLISKDLLGPVSTEGAVRWTALTAYEEKLAAIVKKHPKKLLQINVSMFGFSRGAAQARAAAFWLSQLCERQSEGGGLVFAGVPLRIGFMGIFDTVASVGLGDIVPFVDGHMAWGSGTQSIHPVVEDCVHFVALHEQRASFPLEAAVGRGNVGYPGMHSDVGGGYWPGEQGRAMPDWEKSPHLSQIPLMDMHFAAIKAGVPMNTIEQIKDDPDLAASFATDPKLMGVYNNWLAGNAVKGGEIRQFTEAHTRHYIRWRASLHQGKAKGVTGHDFYKRAPLAKDKTDLKEADDDFGVYLRFLQERHDANSTFFGYIKERAKDAISMSMTISPLRTIAVDPGKSPLSAYEEKFFKIAMKESLPAACIPLFEDYVHDSRAGFRVGGSHEPILLTGGYLKYRHVFKEAIHSESAVYGLANQGISAAKAAANAFLEFLDELWDFTTTTYRKTRHAIYVGAKKTEAAVIEAEKATVRAAIKAEHATVKALTDAERAVSQNAAKIYRDAKAYKDAEIEVVKKYIKAEKEFLEQLKSQYF